MNINVECNEIEFNPELSLEENGLSLLFAKYNNRGVFDLNDLFNREQIRDIAITLKALKQKGVFEIKETNEHDSLVINIINEQSYKQTRLKDLSKNKKLQVCFQLNEAKIASISRVSNDKKSFRFNLVNVCFENYTKRKLREVTINSKTDFIELLSSITPFETILIQGKTLRRKDFEAVFDLINETNVDLGLLNFAIDYAITSSVYGNLNYEFVQTLLDSWVKNDVGTIDQAIDFVHKFEAHKKNAENKFVQPNYQKADEKLETTNSELGNIFLGDDSFE